jgi:D-alanyl-D-alanine carboxypeptidase (penicillin-binding protein 5/6)
MYLRPGETYSLRELLEGLLLASGNDAALAIAETVCADADSFVALMNRRAEELGLENTHYVNCTGLPADGQYTCARDVAVISQAVTKHPTYFTYSSTWLDSLTHPSGRTTDLTNTNRLVRFYKDCDGLKTGSTSEAKYCLSATAERNGMRLIAVVLGVPNSQTRFDEARGMMDYGFANYNWVQVAKTGDLVGVQVPVKLGARDAVDVSLGSGLSLLLRNGQQSQLSFETHLPEFLNAPVEAGEPLGTVQVLQAGRPIAELPAVAAYSVRLPGLLEGFFRLLENWR